MIAGELLLLVGLTGVGKSTLLRALAARWPGARLLPDRRALADAIVIPEAQRLLGEPVAPVTDRRERFRLTAVYRQHEAGGMAHALHAYLREQGARPDARKVFDNLRGVDEVRAATLLFPRARYLVLEAHPRTRMARLSGRRDAFDRFHASPGHDSDGSEAEGEDDEATRRARRIVQEEARHYDATAARAYLERSLDDHQLLTLDTDTVTAEAGADRVAAWWPAT